jgi:hypothetical protein
MIPPERQCQGCGRAFPSTATIGRHDVCPDCGVDLHSCVQCEFYEPTASNQCREPQAERVGDKEQSNFCEFFRLSRRPGGGKTTQTDDARAKLEALFRK